MNRIRQYILGLFLLVFTVSLSGVEPGGILETAELYKTAETVLQPPQRDAKTAESAYEVILFFDVLSPDAGDCLRMLDGIPDLFDPKPVSVTALARNGKDTVSGALRGFRPELLTVYANSADGSAFAPVTSTEVLLPVVMILKEGKVIWKGAPSDVEDVLSRLFAGNFSLQKQVQLNLLRRELQAAVQAGLPQVILRTADQILTVEPADTIAVQAKLYVLEGQRRSDLAKDFLLKQIQKAPEDVKLRLVLLNLLAESGDRETFRDELKKALNEFRLDFTAITRVLAFTLNNAPFGWIPLAEARAAAVIMMMQGTVPPKRVQIYRLEICARLAYLVMDIEEAVTCQRRAAELSGAEPVKAMLQYYESVKALKKQ